MTFEILRRINPFEFRRSTSIAEVLLIGKINRDWRVGREGRRVKSPGAFPFSDSPCHQWETKRGDKRDIPSDHFGFASYAASPSGLPTDKLNLVPADNSCYLRAICHRCCIYRLVDTIVCLETLFSRNTSIASLVVVEPRFLSKRR